MVEKDLIGKNAGEILRRAGIACNGDPALLVARVPNDHPLVWTEQMMPVLPVTSVPDDRKGERLVVLHTRLGFEPDRVIDRLRDTDLPRLWIPRKDGFVEVDEIPKLGTGKVDLRGLRVLATERA